MRFVDNEEFRDHLASVRVFASTLNDVGSNASSPVMSPAEPSDAALVARWQAGDESAAGELVHRHSAVLGRYLISRGATSDDCEDLLQELFLRAFRGIEGWRQEAPFRGWLFRIGANLLRDGHRRSGGRQFVELRPEDQLTGEDPGAVFQAVELAERVRSGLALLSPMQREVFLLRVEQGLDYREVAAALETTEGAARVHYHTAVKRLRERLR